ncbi:MAG TPA: RNase adapter RapZ [Gammaproteobacteria bacterium]|nr:RNase adapter RapZ [Gammaproteobacteria bacterium]
MDLTIVSGLSGSGKTVALQALEDIGYYCIDNLPANLLPHFAASLMHNPDSRAAVSIDIRNRHFLESLPDSLADLKRLGIEFRILYLYADEKTLIKRFSETRRRHPLTDMSISLIEGIRQEHQLLASLAQSANMEIDSSHITPHELRSKVRDLVGIRDGASMMLQIVSFGHKHGNPSDADFVFDVRCLPNPYWEKCLREQTGVDQDVINFLKSKPSTAAMIDHIYNFLSEWLPAFETENRSYITIAIGCTGGRHRSVYVAEQLAEKLKNDDSRVHLQHRDLI